MAELVIKLSREIVERLKPYGIHALQRFWDCVRSIQTGITFSPSGEVSFNVQLGDIHVSTNTLDEIFHYFSEAEKPCLIAIDEFQQIASYPEKNVEAVLRTFVQQCRNAQFIFAGSQRHTMTQMFTSASRPFFQSVSVMHIGSIDINQYDRFAQRHFVNAEKQLCDGVISKVYEYSRGITWYTQKILNTMYANCQKGESCDEAAVDEALDYILKTSDYGFKEIMFRIPEKQKMVLVAIAKEGVVSGVTSGAFIRKYKLPSASTVQSAVRGLLEKDFISLEQGMYYVYDLFLAYWIQRNM